MPLSLSPKRGDVLRVRLDPTEGSEQAGERPVLVVSPDPINDHSPVILVAPLTSRKVDRLYPFEALVEPPEGGLAVRSKVLLTHLRSVNKQRITRYCGSVGDTTMASVEEAIRVATGLIRY